MLVISSLDANNAESGLISKLKEKGFRIPSNKYLSFQTSISDEDHIPENVIDNSLDTHWYSNESYPFFTLNFGNNKVSLKGFRIHGIYKPVTISFNISGSNDGSEWELIETYENLGDSLNATQETFEFMESTNLYNSIKFQSILSKWDSGPFDYGFGMYELELFGIFATYHYFLHTQQYDTTIIYRICPSYLSIIFLIS